MLYRSLPGAFEGANSFKVGLFGGGRHVPAQTFAYNQYRVGAGHLHYVQVRPFGLLPHRIRHRSIWARAREGLDVIIKSNSVPYPLSFGLGNIVASPTSYDELSDRGEEGVSASVDVAANHIFGKAAAPGFFPSVVGLAQHQESRSFEPSVGVVGPDPGRERNFTAWAIQR